MKDCIAIQILTISIGLLEKLQTSSMFCCVRFQQALTNSFADLQRMSWLSAASMFVRNLLYPFRQHGLFGCLVCLVVYPVIVPISLIFCFIYSLPVVYLTCRVVHHVFNDGHRLTGDRKSAFNEMVQLFEAENVISSLKRNKSKWSVVVYCLGLLSRRTKICDYLCFR